MLSKHSIGFAAYRHGDPMGFDYPALSRAELMFIVLGKLDPVFHKMIGEITVFLEIFG
jgi:hypothetical protein